MTAVLWDWLQPVVPGVQCCSAMLQGPAAYKEGGTADPSEGNPRSLSRTTSMLKPTDRCQRVLISEASLSASVTPHMERLLLVGSCPLLMKPRATASFEYHTVPACKAPVAQ